MQSRYRAHEASVASARRRHIRALGALGEDTHAAMEGTQRCRDAAVEELARRGSDRALAADEAV